MSTPLEEHDYIGLSEVEKIISSSSSSSTISTEENEKNKKNNALNLKETELRLGLPGSESPDRKGGGVGASLLAKGLEEKNGYPPLALLKTFIPGTKRGFSDAIDGSGKWVFPGNGGSEADLGKGAVLFSPRGGSGGGKPLGGLENSNQQPGSCVSTVKDVTPMSPKPLQEKKPQISAASDHAPPAK